jgi:hypothetical protein
VDGVAADAQAQGLMHLGSFYVNMSQSSTAPPNALHSSNHQQQQLSMNGVRRSCDGGSGDSNDSNGSMGGNCNGSMGGNCNGSYRPAPRTQHLASRLYARSGNQVGLGQTSVMPW